VQYDTEKRAAFHAVGVIDDVEDIPADAQTGAWNIPGNTGRLRNVYSISK
jgi:hypothetical protein